MVGLVIAECVETAATICPCYTYWRWPITKSFGNYLPKGVGVGGGRADRLNRNTYMTVTATLFLVVGLSDRGR